jgi:hypothetical protein
MEDSSNGVNECTIRYLRVLWGADAGMRMMQSHLLIM